MLRCWFVSDTCCLDVCECLLHVVTYDSAHLRSFDISKICVPAYYASMSCARVAFTGVAFWDCFKVVCFVFCARLFVFVAFGAMLAFTFVPSSHDCFVFHHVARSHVVRHHCGRQVYINGKSLALEYVRMLTQSSPVNETTTSQKAERTTVCSINLLMHLAIPNARNAKRN